jgi:hypothetical protein
VHDAPTLYGFSKVYRGTIGPYTSNDLSESDVGTHESGWSSGCTRSS